MACGIKRIITFNTAFVYGEISIFNDMDINISSNCLYSWSADGVCWTNWVNYADYLAICKNIENDMFWRVIFTDSLKAVMIDTIPTTCYTVTLDDTNPFLQEFCGNENLFNPYANLDCALLMQQQMSDNIICMLGIPIYYFKVDPQQETADYTFKEYLLHNVTSVKQIKLMLQDGALPSSKPVFGDDDFNWEVDWEVEISKTQFARAFGDNAFPSQRDIIYVPMMKRLWSVNAAYDEKQEGFMWRSTTWNLALIKYAEKTNVDEGDYESIIQSFIDNDYFKTFEPYERIEQERESGTTQADITIYKPNNLYDVTISDAIRAQYSKTLCIKEKQYNQLSVIAARNEYVLTDDDVIIYQPKACTESGAASLILHDEVTGEGDCKCGLKDKLLFKYGNVELRTIYDKNKKCSIVKFGTLVAPLECIKEYSTGTEYISDYMILMRWNRDNFTSELNIYPYVHRDAPQSKLKPSMYYFDFDNPIATVTGAYDTEYHTIEPTQIILQGKTGMSIAGIKLFNQAIELKELMNESVKYTTNNLKCIVNDCVRPFNDNYNLGYQTK